MAAKVIAKWPEAEQEWLRSLPPAEREFVELLVAHFQAWPQEEQRDDD